MISIKERFNTVLLKKKWNRDQWHFDKGLIAHVVQVFIIIIGVLIFVRMSAWATKAKLSSIALEDAVAVENRLISLQEKTVRNNYGSNKFEQMLEDLGAHVYILGGALSFSNSVKLADTPPFVGGVSFEARIVLKKPDVYTTYAVLGFFNEQWPVEIKSLLVQDKNIIIKANYYFREGSNGSTN